MINESLLSILPKEIGGVVSRRLNPEKVYELRFRAERPVLVNYGGIFYYLGPDGLKSGVSDSYFCKKSLIGEIIVRASEYSLYAYNDRISNGYITIAGGIRIGIAGEAVLESGEIKTIKNFSSLNIRIPHEVMGCADGIYNLVCRPVIYNTLIISPPGAGKTTLLRDLTRLLGNGSPPLNVLLIDERNEIAAVNEGTYSLDVGINTDVISSSGKDFAFKQGVRALRPDIIITDELFGEKDLLAVEDACACGVKVFASVHAYGLDDIKKKSGFENILKKRLFQRLVCLSSHNGPGTVDGVYNENFERITALKC